MGDWDLAVARYTRALEKDPNNIGYKIALENARLQASRLHYDAARKALAANDFPKAAEELEIAAKYDPANRSAADDLAARARPQPRKQDEDKAERAEFEADAGAGAGRGARAAAGAVAAQPRADHDELPRARACRRSWRAWARSRASTCCSTRASATSATSRSNLTGVTLPGGARPASRSSTGSSTRSSTRTRSSSSRSRARSGTSYDELLLRTFFVQNAEINETVNLVKTLAKVQTVAGNPSARARSPCSARVDQIAMADRIIELNDKAARRDAGRGADPRGQPQRPRRSGGSTSRTTPRASTLSPTGRENEITAGLLNIRAHLLSSLNQADWVVSLPVERSSRASCRTTRRRASWPRRGCARPRARRPS